MTADNVNSKCINESLQFAVTPLTPVTFLKPTVLLLDTEPAKGKQILFSRNVLAVIDGTRLLQKKKPCKKFRLVAQITRYLRELFLYVIFHPQCTYIFIYMEKNCITSFNELFLFELFLSCFFRRRWLSTLGLSTMCYYSLPQLILPRNAKSN